VHLLDEIETILPKKDIMSHVTILFIVLVMIITSNNAAKCQRIHLDAPFFKWIDYMFL
jgi:hypothetical protein